LSRQRRLHIGVAAGVDFLWGKPPSAKPLSIANFVGGVKGCLEKIEWLCFGSLSNLIFGGYRS